jgi:hypothetical protein
MEEFGRPLDDEEELAELPEDQQEFGRPLDDPQEDIIEKGQEFGRAIAEENAGEEPTATDYAAALAADIAISEGGRMAGASIGSVVPVVGTGVGWVLGGLSAGAAGSVTRQKMLGQDISYGEVVADMLLNVIPVPKAFKLFKNKTANLAAFQGMIGTGTSVGAEVIEKSISEDRLPTVEELESAGVRGFTLGAGLGAAGSKMDDAYRKFSGVGRDELNEAYKMGDPDAKILVDGALKNAKQHQEDVRNNYKKMRLAIKTATMDSRAQLQELQKTSGGGQIKSKGGVFEVMSDDVDYNMNSRLAEGIIAGKNAEIENIIDLDNKFLVSKSDEIGVNPIQLSDSINKYLYAKHALSFNKAKAKGFKGEGGPAGITNDEAKDIIKNFEKSKLNTELKDILDSRRDLSKRILDTLEDGGLMGKAEAAQLRKTFPDYVPLNRIMDQDGKFRPGMFTAVGSEREVSDIGANIVGNLSAAIRRAELNKANKSFLRLVQKKKNQKAAKDIVQIYKPREGTKKFDLPEGIEKDSVVTVYDNGVPTAMAFKDKELASAMRGQNREVLGSVMKAALWYNRTIGSMYTRFNPEFVIPNLSRDRSEAIVNAAAKMDLGNALRVANPINDIITIRRNLFSKGKVSTDPKAAEMDALYKQFVTDGGSTGNLGATTIQSVEESIEKMKKSLSNPRASKTRDFLKVWDKINAIVEDSTRFNVYRRGLDSGMTRKQAALAARDSSFDPLVKGTKGDTLRAAYLFANPAIQGGRNFLRSMRNPRVLSSVIASMMTGTLALDLFNQSTDPDWKEKMKSSSGSSWKTDKSLTIVYGKNPDGSLKHVSIPIGYSIAPFKKVADYLQQKVIQQRLMGIEPSVVEAEKSLGEQGKELFKAFIDGYNPMGGSLLPTPLRPWFELAQNKDGLGNDIRPSWLETKNISDTEKMFPWTMDTRGGEMAISFSEQLKNMGYEVSPESLGYLYQTWVGGPGGTVKRLFNITSNIVNKEPIPKRDWPVLRRFFGDSAAKTFEERGYDNEIIENLDKAYGTERQKAIRIASSTFKKMKAKESGAEKRLVLRNVIQDNPELAPRILKSLNTKFEDDSVGMTSQDRRLKYLPIEARAEFLLKKIDTMPPANLSQYLSVMQQRGILTPKVVNLVLEMKALREYGQ